MDRKPGRPRALTVGVIAQAALDDGIDSFSMPSVARRLGVAHSGLYRYVTDRDDLLVQAIDMAFAAQEWPDPQLPWDELINEIGETVWRACDSYRGLDRAMQQIPKPAPSVLVHMEKYVASVQAQGFLLEDAAVGVEFAITLALDCSAQMARYGQMAAKYPDREQIPVIKPYDTDEVWSGRGLYGRKLAIFVTGLATRRIQPGS